MIQNLPGFDSNQYTFISNTIFVIVLPISIHQSSPRVVVVVVVRAIIVYTTVGNDRYVAIIKESSRSSALIVVNLDGMIGNIIYAVIIVFENKRYKINDNHDNHDNAIDDRVIDRNNKRITVVAEAMTHNITIQFKQTPFDNPPYGFVEVRHHLPHTP